MSFSEWNQYKIGDTCELITGFPFKSKEYLDKGKYKVVRGDNVKSGFIYWEEKTRCWNELSSRLEKCILNKGDIVVGMDGSRVGKNKAIINNNDLPALLAQRVACIRANEGFDQSYISYVVLSDLFEMYVDSIKTGTSIPHISLKQIADFTFSAPNLKEQKRIAKILSDLDEKIKINNNINSVLENIANTLYTSWFVKFEPFIDSEFIETEYGVIPKELEITRIEELQPKLETGKRPKGGVGTFNAGMPSVGAESIKGIGTFDYSKTKYVPRDYALNMKKGIISGYELLIYKDGGKPGYFKPNFSMFGEGFPFDSVVLNEHVFLLDFGDRGFNIFSYFHFQSEHIRHLLHTVGCKAAVPGINQKDILSLFIFSKDNPKVKEFCDIVSPMITTILKNSKQNRELSKIRDLLLPKLMSGEIRVSIDSHEE
ncbi:hypothetical protein K144313037_17550 [Clostridium tetani]|uniref:restriction endonuclease subunit S n=1 Tax=Clostridium tetani TaxID=1513 RepID=UPI000D210A3C|nr:restriction endonuclease subunit S [Clostridium tetani]AVP55278.1 hypothetical protein C3B72_09035 [Clostridium tetani]BDR70343.1 hypothetical protein K144313037_17550 [Clostridium tetani]BDR84417.1 hypothetical protein K254310026_18280 [Clostridium tetani]BEV19981.1 hypothetical protein K154301001_18360 [Clostridium tetani]